MFRRLTKAIRNWWLILILGILNVLAAMAVFISPVTGTLIYSVILISDLIATGVFGIMFIISNRDVIPNWGLYLILPVLTTVSAICLSFNLGASLLFASYFFASGILFNAVEIIMFAISLSGIKGTGWGWILAGGIISLILSIYLFIDPVFTSVTVGTFVAMCMMFAGISAIYLSIQMGKLKHRLSAVVNAISEETAVLGSELRDSAETMVEAAEKAIKTAEINTEENDSQPDISPEKD